MDYSYIPRPAPDEGIHIESRLFIISADLAQTTDYTAISVIERITKGKGISGFKKQGEKRYHLRHIERPPRGTEYPAIIDANQELKAKEKVSSAAESLPKICKSKPFVERTFEAS